MPSAPTKAVEVFYSYAHKDEDLRDHLAEHLASLQRQGYIKEWHDRRIGAGTEWAQEIDTHLNTASIILLLISSSFLASDYCYGIEMQQALQRHQAKEAHVIPILLRPVDWHGTPFEALQVLPANAKPITTWTNQDEAFLEVTRGLRKVIEAWTSSTVSTPLSSEQYWNVPSQRNPYFTNQEALLTRLHSQFGTDVLAASMHTQAISGLGGIGKTQLALEYAYRHRDAYRAVLWINADSRETLVSGYLALATLLGLPRSDAQDQSIIVQAVKHWLETYNQWLLILDNADDVAMVRDFLPLAGKGHILLTTRASAQGTTVAQDIGMEPMEETEGALFLLRRARVLLPHATLDQATSADCTTAKAIGQELGRLPLAIDQAGAYVEETGCGLSGYLERYRSQHATLLGRRGRLVTDHPESVATTWLLSFQKVEQTSAAAADLLRLCAFLHPDAIPEELITEGAPDLGPTLQRLANDLIALDETMEALRAYSLLRRTPGSNTLAIHHLVQAVLRDGMGKDQQIKWIERAIQALNRLFPNPEEVTQWPLCQRLILHAQACAALIAEQDIVSAEAARLLTVAGYYLRERAQYAEAEPLSQRALAIREQVLGPNHPDTAISLYHLAWLYHVQGKYIEAEPLSRRALAIREQVLGPNHPDTATSLNNMAALYHVQGKYVEAEALYQRALAIYEQVLGPNHPHTATSLYHLAVLYHNQGKYAKAEPLSRRALAIREQVLGPNHPDTATSLYSLANLYHIQGKYVEAEALYQRALAIREQVLGPNHPHTATSLNNLAVLYRVQDKYAEAEPLYQRALAIYEQVLGPNHPATQRVRANYDTLLRQQHHSP